MEPHEVDFYQRLADEHRGTSRQVAAWSPASQALRYAVLMDVLDSMLGERLRGLRLLDFGCGRGDLAAWLADHGRMDDVRYLGVDGIQANVDDARARGLDVRLVRWDGRGTIVDEPVDVILFSGVFMTTAMDRRLAMLREMLEQARVGVVGNFLTWKPGVDDWGPGTILMEPAEALSAIDRHAFRFQLRADYLPHDFTIGAVRRDR